MGKSSLGFGGYENARKSSGTISAAAHDGISREVTKKFVIDMNENDGYVHDLIIFLRNYFEISVEIFIKTTLIEMMMFFH